MNAYSPSPANCGAIGCTRGAPSQRVVPRNPSATPNWQINARPASARSACASLNSPHVSMALSLPNARKYSVEVTLLSRLTTRRRFRGGMGGFLHFHTGGPVSDTYFERFRRMMDAMEFETLPLFSKPYFSWHLKTDYTGRRFMYRPTTESTMEDARRMLERWRVGHGAV